MISVTTQIERWELVEPFTTARDSITHVPVLLVTLTGRDGSRGWAEAAGVDYDGETPATLAAQIVSVQKALHDKGAQVRNCSTSCQPVARVTPSIARCGTCEPRRRVSLRRRPQVLP